jgi:hypothetical protein
MPELDERCELALVWIRMVFRLLALLKWSGHATQIDGHLWGGSHMAWASPKLSIELIE